MDLLDLLRAARRRWLWIAVPCVLAVAIGWATTPATDDDGTSPGSMYLATVTLIADPVETPSEMKLARSAFLVKAEPVKVAVALRIGSDDPDALADRVQATGDPRVGTIQITTTSGSSADAEMLADAYAAELLTYLAGEAQTTLDRRLEQASIEVSSLREQIATLDAALASDPFDDVSTAVRSALITELGSAEQRLGSVRAQGAEPVGLLQLEAASASLVSDTGGFADPHSRTSRVVLGGLLGLAIGAALAMFVETIDPRLRSAAVAESIAPSLPVATDVPTARRGQQRRATRSRAARSLNTEAHRRLRTVLLHTMRSQAADGEPEYANGGANHRTDERRRSIVVSVTSPRGGEGKSSTIAGLAEAFAEYSARVLILDWDLRDVVRDSSDTSDHAVLFDDDDPSSYQERIERVARPTSIAGVRVLPAGTDSPGLLLARSGELIRAARDVADVVLIDTQPLLAANDVAELAASVDALVVVYRAKRTRVDDVRRVDEILGRLQVPALLAVLVGTSRRRRGAQDRRAQHRPLALTLTRVEPASAAGSAVGGNGATYLAEGTALAVRDEVDVVAVNGNGSAHGASHETSD